MSEEHFAAPTLFVCENTLYRLAKPRELFHAARQAMARQFHPGRSLTSPTLVRDYLRLMLTELEHEVFYLILLDNRHRLIDALALFRGTIDGSAVHPREVVKETLKHNASAVLCRVRMWPCDHILP